MAIKSTARRTAQWTDIRVVREAKAERNQGSVLERRRGAVNQIREAINGQPGDGDEKKKESL